MEHRVKSLEHNGLIGKIGEQVARSYVRRVLAAKLMKEELWDHVILSNNGYRQRVRSMNLKLVTYDFFREEFLSNGFSAGVKLLSKYAEAMGILERNHCTPDGMLLKLKETGPTRKVKQSECPFSARLHLRGFQSVGGYFFHLIWHRAEVDESVPTVEMSPPTLHFFLGAYVVLTSRIFLGRGFSWWWLCS